MLNLSFFRTQAETLPQMVTDSLVSAFIYFYEWSLVHLKLEPYSWPIKNILTKSFNFNQKCEAVLKIFCETFQPQC